MKAHSAMHTLTEAPSDLRGSKAVLAELRQELCDVIRVFPRLGDYVSNLFAAIDTRINDRFKPVDARDICAITERANVIFAAQNDLRDFSDDPANTARVYQRLDAIAKR